MDTSLFPADFQARVLSALSQQFSDGLDAHLNGTLIHADNFQALNLLQARYRGQVKCIYIDPPFNLGSNGDFLYKTDYKDSSWLTLLTNRIALSNQLLSSDGYFYLRCDNNGNSIAKIILNDIFGEQNFEAELLVQRIRKNITNQGKITLPLANDSLFLYAKSDRSKFINPYLKLKEARQSYWRRIDDSAGFRNPPERIIFGAVFKPYKHDAHFKYSQKSIDEMIKNGRIRLRCKGKNCKYEHLSGDWQSCPLCGSIDATPQYLVLESDTQILDTNWLDIAGYSHTTGFSTENSEVLLTRSLDVCSTKNELVMDYFSGSGTTLSVAMQTNRKFIGVEQGEQLHTIIIPRLSKLAYNKNISQVVKILKLESYEDTLNNLALENPNRDLFGHLPESAQSDYVLRYMLDVESRASLLNVSHFAKPFDYEMDIAEGSAGAGVRRKVDLVETFNYLLGLTVVSIDDRRFDRGYVMVTGRLPQQSGDDNTLIVWRDCERWPQAEDLFDRLRINPQNTEFAAVYLNGDHTLTTAWSNENGESGRLKIRQTEAAFLDLMFAEVR